MNEARIQSLSKLAKEYFDIASAHLTASNDWDEQLRKALAGVPIKEEAELPGFETKNIKFGRFENREFVVMMTDIRKSTDIINGPNGVVKMFLIFYIYAGIVAKIVDEKNGTSTEFLGDGVLNLFDTKEFGLQAALRSSMEATWEIFEARELVLNPFFLSVGLPPIDFGIGIDHGTTIVTKFGYRGDTDLKAFGQCAYNVSKLSKGMNVCYVSDNSQAEWPVGEGGKLQFLNPININGKIAYPSQKLA